MARRIAGAITRGLRQEWKEPRVHFHQGPLGRPVPCFDARCERPHLDVD